MKIRKFLGAAFLATVLIVTALLSTPFALANEVTSQDRIDLFLASRTMLMEQRKPPKMKVGMVLSTLGEDSEISMGVRVEHRLGEQDNLTLLTETIYLKQEKTVAGFLSLKYLPFGGGDPLAMYIGAGVGYAQGFRYQAFAGVDLTKYMFAEIRYASLPGGFGDSGLYLATGFQFAF